MLQEPLKVSITFAPSGIIIFEGPQGMAQLVPEEVVPLVNKPEHYNLVLNPLFIKPTSPDNLNRAIGQMVRRVMDRDNDEQSFEDNPFDDDNRDTFLN